uniref:NADH dehydrogenase [ubiquinone] 1 beta subcomplex subunit 2, mitochondrial n=1 Tax=Gopherus agassizii TaxID=38772 RepID=A0A452ITU0_9SAUR
MEVLTRALGRIGSSLVRILHARDVRGAAGLRHSGGGVHIEPHYRQFPRGFTWFWILWHFWHNPESVLGHFPYPDASKWTDEELGILPDDEE